LGAHLYIDSPAEDTLAPLRGMGGASAILAGDLCGFPMSKGVQKRFERRILLTNIHQYCPALTCRNQRI
jgi:ribosomal protein S6E (S10)